MKSSIRIVLLLLSVLAINSLQAQNSIVLTVENENITVEDFEAIFRKNNRDSAVSRESLDEYMELFIDFKLKVREAKEMGMDTNQAFIKELDGYRKQLARPYLTDSEMLDGLVKEAYERKKTEIRASHILVTVDPNAAPEDTLKAWNKIITLRKRIVDGKEDFEAVARSKSGSEDPSVADNGGDLGYFSVFQMVYPFEEAAYSLNVGEISSPIRTRFGYHLVKVTDRRNAMGEVKVAHIMLRVADIRNEEEVRQAETRAREVYNQLLDGATFTDLALKYSDDKTTSRKGGELPWFGTGKMVEEFEKVAFALKTGELAEPFLTQYGWHIVKKLESKDIPPFEEIQADLKGKVSRDTRADITRDSFIEKLKKEYAYKSYPEVLKKLTAVADTGIYEGFLTINSKLANSVLMEIDGKVYLASEFANYLGQRKQNRKLKPAEVVANRFEEWAEDRILTYEDSRLEGKHNAFRLLMNEYRDGILLFELTDQKVWSKAVNDTTGLELFYEQNKNNYLWPERARVEIFRCSSQKVAAKVKKLAKKKTGADIVSALNKKSALNVQLEEGLFSREEKELLTKIEWKNGPSESVEFDGQYYIIDFNEIVAPLPKKISEAKGAITADYQDYLEKEWESALRKKYRFQINKDVLYSIR
jgi:peptidyl-prolyl cis-trans isomerase SurA